MQARATLRGAIMHFLELELERITRQAETTRSLGSSLASTTRQPHKTPSLAIRRAGQTMLAQEMTQALETPLLVFKLA
jgi:hypothetical protein